MKSKKWMVAQGFVLVLLVVSAFWFGTAYAATGCFSDTNGHWAEAAICWAAENGVVGGFPDGTFKPNNTVTRAQVAVMLKNQADVPPSSGLITINQSPGAWQKFSDNDNTSLTRFSDMARFSKATTGSNYFTLQPLIPVSLYGKTLELLGVEMCYDADPGAYLNYIELNVTEYTTSGLGSFTGVAVDGTDRTDDTCRYYPLTTPWALTGNSTINVFVIITWTNNSVNFTMGRTTLVFRPTGSNVAVPMLPSSDSFTPLTEASESQVEVPSSSAP